MWGYSCGKYREIGIFKIISESSISSGVRRIEAITGRSVAKYLTTLDKKIKDISKLLNTDINSIEDKITSLSENYRQVNKKYQGLSLKYNAILLQQNIKEVHNIKTVCLQMEDADVKEMRNLINNFSQKKDAIILLYLVQDNKASFVLTIPEQYAKKLDAKVKEEFLGILEGNGGGNFGSLQGRGNPKKITTAFDYLLTNLK